MYLLDDLKKLSKEELIKIGMKHGIYSSGTFEYILGRLLYRTDFSVLLTVSEGLKEQGLMEMVDLKIKDFINYRTYEDAINLLVLEVFFTLEGLEGVYGVSFQKNEQGGFYAMDDVFGFLYEWVDDDYATITDTPYCYDEIKPVIDAARLLLAHNLTGKDKKYRLRLLTGVN